MNLFPQKKNSLLALFALTALATQAQMVTAQWVKCNNEGCTLLDPYYSEGVTLNWEGGCLNGKAHGSGTLTKYKNGEYESTFEGNYDNGSREGFGTFTHKDKSVTTGYFTAGQLNGQGKRIYEDGSVYEGEFIHYRQHGKGTLHYASGTTFEGYFVSDKPYTGTYTTLDFEVEYVHQFKYVTKIVEEKSSGCSPEIGKRVTEYFDEEWNRCKKENAAFYRLITYAAANKPQGTVKDYHISGELQSEFNVVHIDYDDEGKNFHEGASIWYFKNGNLEQKKYYFNNKLHGINSRYYETGQLFEEITYQHGVGQGLYQQWYLSGKLKATAYYNNGELVDNKYIEYDENGEGATVYRENFRTNESNWTHTDDSTRSYVTGYGFVALNVYGNSTHIRGNYITLNQEADYSIECIVQKETGTGTDGYGMFFGFKDWNNYYKFLISELGYFKVLGKIEGIDINLCEWTGTNAIFRGNQRNLLKMMKIGDEFIFSLNGVIVLRTETKLLRGNAIGIYAAGIGRYILETLMVKEFIPMEEVSEVVPDANAWLGNGSGFFIHPKGYIATNYHVIADASEIQVTYYQQGTKYSHTAKVVVTDKQNDLAIIQITDPSFQTLPAIPYVFSTNIQDLGTDVFALGYPMANVMGEDIKFTDGKISAKTGIEGDITTYQISVPIQPGNSGGPLFDSKGNLVGITSSALNREKFNAENVNYAIKATYLKNLIDVMPGSISLPNDTTIYNKSLTEKIKVLSDFTPIIRIR